MIDVEKCDINVTVGNCQKMNYDIKVSVNMKFQYGQTVKLTRFLYIPQAVKNLLSVSRIMSKGATMGSTPDKITIKNI